MLTVSKTDTFGDGETGPPLWLWKFDYVELFQSAFHVQRFWSSQLTGLTCMQYVTCISDRQIKSNKISHDNCYWLIDKVHIFLPKVCLPVSSPKTAVIQFIGSVEVFEVFESPPGRGRRSMETPKISSVWVLDNSLAITCCPEKLADLSKPHKNRQSENWQSCLQMCQ